MSSSDDTTWRLIRQLSYAGLIPFVLLAMLLWLSSEWFHPFVALALQGYGAVIVSFLGGIHWGVGFRNALSMHNAPRFAFWWGISASLLAWVSVMMPAYAGLPLLGLLLLACYLVDRRTWPAMGLAPWLGMRLHLTVVAALSCLIAAGAT